MKNKNSEDDNKIKNYNAFHYGISVDKYLHVCKTSEPSMFFCGVLVSNSASNDHCV